MPAVTPTAFRKSVQSLAFAGAYCLHGEDDYSKDRAVRGLIEVAVNPATREFNVDVRAGAKLDAEALDSLLATPPMMSERRVVVVRDAGLLRKATQAALMRYLERTASRPGSPDIILALVYPAGEKGSPDRKILDRSTSVQFDALGDRDIARWIARYAREVDMDITPEAIALLQRAAGADLHALAAELDKLANYSNGAQVGEDAVTAVVGVHRGRTMGDLLDSIARRDAREALAILPSMLELPKSSAVTTVMALTVQTLALSWGVARRAHGVPAGRLAGEYFDFLKGARGAYTGRPWGEAVKAWVAVIDLWEAPALDASLEALLAADIALKESRVQHDADILETLILSICATDPRQISRARGAAA